MCWQCLEAGPVCTPSLTPLNSTRVSSALPPELRVNCRAGMPSMMCSPPRFGFMLLPMTPITAIPAVSLPLLPSEKPPIPWGFAPFQGWFHGKNNAFPWIRIYVGWCLHHLVIFGSNLEEKAVRQCISLIMTTPLNVNTQIKKADH